MKVIVAGYSKTGTKSLNAALKTLGYSVYDWLENAMILQDNWNKILYEGWTTDDFRQMYENVDVVTDAPAYYFWEEIHKAFPDAKIILMTRDEESWSRSWENQLRAIDQSISFYFITYLSPTARRMTNRIKTRMSDVIFGLSADPQLRRKFNKELAILKYRAHNAYVMQNAPKDKLLVFECTQGWKPLCDFLEVSEPNIEFPHKNKNGNIIQEWLETDPFTKQMQREVYISLGLLTASVAVGGYCLWTRGPVSLLSSVVANFRKAINWINF